MESINQLHLMHFAKYAYNTSAHIIQFSWCMSASYPSECVPSIHDNRYDRRRDMSIKHTEVQVVVV